ncbi:MAG: hypothetical protein Q8O37_10165 [Sulfuricellaceae bacterium]|nr:hypothetical protein [Sulfuricellaceae bacterium]
MFSFISREKPAGIEKQTLKLINDTVVQFLSAREVQQFQVYTIDYENHPVILIQAAPQKKLRFSNILEIQIKNHLKDRYGFQVTAVFWRFKTDNSEQPGPEQADYESEATFASPQEQSTEVATTVLMSNEDSPTETSAPETIINHEVYDVRHLAKKGMEVEEILMGDFFKFLHGESNSDKPAKPEE